MSSLSGISYLNTLTLLSEPESGDESSREEFKSLLKWCRLPVYHQHRQLTSPAYRIVQRRLPRLVDEIEHNVNSIIPERLDRVATSFSLRHYPIAQNYLLRVTKLLARCRLLLRVVSRVSRAGRFSEHLREVLQLQPLYRLNHIAAYAFAQLLRVCLFPPREDLYTINQVQVVASSDSDSE